ncbi:P34-Arc-domain-containing protein [Atractiella rhizophila]|nr:P34-Arc-domain-containing protein [Atractiella rhizophila]
MILLEDSNMLITDFLTEKFNKPGSVDQAFVDFDGVRYHLSTPHTKNTLVLSIDIRCWQELLAYGAEEVIRREYGNWITDTEEGYCLSLKFDVDGIPAEGEERTKLIHSLSQLKRSAMAAPFERAFALQKQFESSPSPPGEPPKMSELMQIHYRPEEAIYVQASQDRVTVFFSTIFKEETDRIFGKVFLQEFVDARKTPSLQSAPQVLYSNREPPLEIRHLPGLSTSENVGYVTFILFPRHYNTPSQAANTISQIQLFRTYLHYHLKCSKAYMQSRMRSRVAEFLKILNRAKPETQTKEKKTATGRTFVRR